MRIITFLLCLFGFSAAAQELGRPFIENYTPRQYKAETQNWSVTQDDQGIMYFANNSGVLIYDGNYWQILPVTNLSTVRSVAIDKNQTVFVGAESEMGYLKTNVQGVKEYVSLLPLLPPEERNFGSVWTIFVQNEAVYFQTYYKIYRYQNGKFDKIWNLRNTYHRLFSVFGKLYVRQDSLGLCSLENENWTVLPNTDLLKDKVISAMFPYDRERILVGTRKNGLFLYHPQKQTVEPFFSEANDFLSKNQLYHGVRLANGNFVFSTILKGMIEVNAAGKTVRILDRTQGVLSDAIYFLYQDRQNTLWAGLDIGLTHIDMNSPISFWNDENGLRGSVLDMIRFEGKLYASTSFGVFCLINNVFVPVQNIEGQMWRFLIVEIGGQKKLLVSGKNLFEIKDLVGTSLFELPNNRNAFHLSQSVQNPNRLWIATDEGVEIFDLQNGKVVYQKDFILKVAHNCRRVLEDREGNLWVGTSNEGISKVRFREKGNLQSAQIQRFNTLESGLPSLKNVNPFWIDNQIYFGTEQGLYRFEESSQKFVKSDLLGKDLEKYNIFDLEIDQQNNIWLASILTEKMPLGVAIREQNNTFRWENTPFLRFPHSIENIVYSENDGLVWFGGSEGIYRYESKITKNYQTPFQALIRRVEADSLLFGGNMYPNFKSPILSYDQRNLRFQFAATSYENEKMNQFSYFLEGYDRTWSAWGLESKKEYTNLPEGNYIFRLKARNIYGLESPETQYTFKILPPWYRTWFAYFGYFMFVGFLVGVVVKIYSKRLKRENLKLEKLILDRTAQITDKNAELLQQTEELQQANEEVLVQRDNLEKAYQNVQLLEEIGKKITANLEVEKIADIVYESLNQLMDASVFLIGLYNSENQAISIISNVEKGEKMPLFFYFLHEKHRPAIWCFDNKKEVLMNDFEKEYNSYFPNHNVPIPKVGETVNSMIYLPLFSKNEVIGVISVQSFQKNAYSQRELNFLRNIAIYTAIALENAESYKNLQATLDHLKATQAQLVQAEKMAGIGTLTAGIAHEINNPINFVKNNIENVETNLQDILAIVHEYEKITPENAEFKLLEIRKLKNKTDFDLAVEEMGELVRGIKEGANRTTEIVKSLRTFTRLDDQALQPANLHANLDSTLLLLQNQYKDRIEIVRNYGEIPEVSCFIGKINQVFMNLLSNAVQAIEGKGTITISTELLNPSGFENPKGLVQIKIRDTGKGIPSDIRDRIFEPFFTTKDVGKGTGLGLSISLGIVQNHHGELIFESEVGEGTEFILTLPVGK